MNRGRFVLNVKGADPDVIQAGGALVVVRDWESPLHGEGAQLNVICACKLPDLNEVKTFDNQ